MNLFRKREPRIPRRKHKGQHYWKSVTRTRDEERYREVCARLDEAGIDYRVWMNADDPNLVYLRKFLGSDNKMVRRYYIFIVRPYDLEKARRVLDIVRPGRWDMTVS